MLRVEGVQKSFDGFMAVSDANLHAAAGQMTAVIGPNGAGKTTLFHLITGQIAADRGSIRFQDEEIAGLPPHFICRKGIGRSYQVVNIFDRLNVFENVRVAVLSQQRRSANLFLDARRMVIRETGDILDQVGLSGKSDRQSGALSHGDRKVLEIAIALGTRPQLLILDEPTAGMAQEETDMVLQLLRRLQRDMGLTLVFCEHDMEMVFALADQIMVLHQGRTLIQDRPLAVRAHPEVQAAYLGDDAC